MTSAQRILVIDDDPMIHKLVSVRLRDINATVTCAESGTAGIAMAHAERPHLILLDVGLLDMTGFYVCARLRDDPLTRDIPIIFLTGTDDPQEKVRAFEMGAVDYVTKPFNPAELRARVRAALRTQALMEALETQALSDKLTGLPNREAFRRAVGRCVDYGRRHPSDYRFAVMFLDLDRFKVINDSLGHAVGDHLLVTVANKLYKCIHQVPPTKSSPMQDLVARLGGDEFAVLLHNVRSHEAVTQIAERIQKEVSTSYTLEGHRVTCTASVGIRISDGANSDVDSLLRDSDTAMYHAKNAGRACSRFFDAHMHEEAMHRMEMENDLEHAIERSELRLVYQPIVDLNSNTLESLEALLRWEHPELGLIEPAVFLGVAEETAQIQKIGRWVLREACMQARDWNRRLQKRVMVTVNLSKAQLTSDSIVKDVADALRDSGLSASCLGLEVTESVMMHESTYVAPILQQLRALGITLGMDGFGTGHSSLSSLHKFPINLIKIDREFIQRLRDNRPYAAIVHAIITLAHNLNLRVVAKGVETAEQLALLQALDCDCAQGYFFKVPLSAEQVEDVIANDIVRRMAAA